MSDDDGASTFRTAPEAYDRHVGRYCADLGRALIGFAAVSEGHRVLDVGCGTGLLTAELASVVGASNVCAVDASEPFAARCRSRVAGADVRVARAERLPFDDAIFDAVLSQLVVNFMTDAPAGVAEMRRVTRLGGVIAGCVWDYAGEMTLLRTFWDAARTVDPASASLDESVTMPYCNRDGLRELWAGAGLRDLEVAVLRPSATYADFDSVWQPFRAGVGPAGAYAAGLNDAGQAALRDEFFRRLGRPTQPFVLSARAWAVAGRR